MFFQLLAGWTSHDEASREFALDVAWAIDTTVGRKAAAEAMRISEAQLSNQLAGREGLNLWKLASVATEFHAALCGRRLRRIGWEVVPPGEVSALLSSARAWFGRKEIA